MSLNPSLAEKPGYAGPTRMVRFAGAVRDEFWNAIVPVTDAKRELVDGRRLDIERDACAKQARVILREAQSHQSIHLVRAQLKVAVGLMDRAGMLDRHCDKVLFQQVPQNLNQAHEALLAGVHLCESVSQGTNDAS